MYLLTLLSQSPLFAVVFLLSLVAAVTVHEFAHAWTAYRLGDDTPYLQGRVTLSPTAHLDPMGSLVFLLLGMGWGKPVQYNPMRLARKSDELLIALAGPASNLIFALALNILIYFLQASLPAYATILSQASFVNIALAAFNMLPIPPLDGSSIVAYFWPEYRSIMGGQIGLMVILVLIFLPIGGSTLISSLINPLIGFFANLTTLFGFI